MAGCQKNYRQLESQIQRSIMDYLTSLSAWFFKPTVTNCKGCPDIIGCYNGRFVAFEVKVPGKEPSKIQQVQIRLINDQGGFARVVRSNEEVKRFIVELGK